MTSSKADTPLPFRQKGFWTPLRLSFTFSVLALVAAFMLPGCQSDAAKSSSNSATVANQPAAPGNPQPAPVARPPLPATILNTELKDLDGKTFKLSDYA